MNESLPRADETLDDLRLGGLKILQKQDGYRFSLDPILLCDFAEVKKGEHVVDLGTGSGVICLLLARLSQAANLTGIEINPELAERAQRNVLLNRLRERVEILHGDVRNIRNLLPPQSVQVVLANPPYREVGRGRIAPGDERAGARHELAGGLDDFLRAACFLLGNGGRFYLVYLAERLTELLNGMRACHLEPKRLRFIHSRHGEDARMVLVEGRRDGRPGVRIEPPLVVYDGETYSLEILKIYDEKGEGASEELGLV